MADITMCKNEACPKRESCYRYLAIPSEYRQSWSEFKPDDKGVCEYYYKLEEGEIEYLLKLKQSRSKK